MTTWGLMVAAILFEAGATTCLRLSDGLGRPWWLVPSVLGYVATFILVSMVLQRGWTLALTYGVWAAGGIILLALADRFLLGESLRWTAFLGMAFAITGIALMQHGTGGREGHTAHGANPVPSVHPEPISGTPE